MKSALPIPVESTGCVICGSHDASVEARGRDYLYGTSDQEFRFVRCSACGHLYLNPRPTIAAIGRIYPPEYSSFSGKFSRPESWVASIKERVLLRRFAKIADDLPTRFRLMDVGCGDGQFLLALRRLFPQAELVGLDWNFAPSVTAKFDGAKISRITGAIEDVDITGQSFDVITMIQLIEHLWDPRRVLECCGHALKPHGWLVIETPNPDGYDRRLLFRAGAWGSYYWPRHLNLFSRSHLTTLVEEAGLRAVQWKPLLAPPCWTYSVRSAAMRLGYRGQLLHRILSDTNPLALAFFAAIDLGALAAGVAPSNQKLIAARSA